MQAGNAIAPWLARARQCATPAELFVLLEAAGSSLVGHCLFSVNAAELNPLRVRRLYSSNPAAYPVGGFKDKHGTEWGQTVLLDQQTLICRGRAELGRAVHHQRAGCSGRPMRRYSELCLPQPAHQ